jgi:hypothetical protein
VSRTQHSLSVVGVIGWDDASTIPGAPESGACWGSPPAALEEPHATIVLATKTMGALRIIVLTEASGEGAQCQAGVPADKRGHVTVSTTYRSS